MGNSLLPLALHLQKKDTQLVKVASRLAAKLQVEAIHGNDCLDQGNYSGCLHFMTSPAKNQF